MRGAKAQQVVQQNHDSEAFGMARTKFDIYLLALVAMVRVDDGGLVTMISASTWPKMKPLLWIWKGGKRREQVSDKTICLLVSAEVVPVMASKRTAFLVLNGKRFRAESLMPVDLGE
jgi:hypothetical protein